MDGWLRILISKLFIGKFSFGLGVGTHHGAGSQILPTLGPGSRPFNIRISPTTRREYIRCGVIVVSVGVDWGKRQIKPLFAFLRSVHFKYIQFLFWTNPTLQMR